MQANNPMTREFLAQYPHDAARTLERLSPEHVAAFCEAIPSSSLQETVAAMVPAVAARAVAAMSTEPAATLLQALPMHGAARILRSLDREQVRAITAKCSTRWCKQVDSYLTYPANSVGSQMQVVHTVLPQSLTVSEARHRLEHTEHAIPSEIYVVDNQHRLTGMLHLGKLFTSNPHTVLRNLADTRIAVLSAFASVDTLLANPSWLLHRRLPVVDRSNMLVGEMAFRRASEITEHKPGHAEHSSLQNLLSLTGLYWLTAAQLIDSVIGINPGKKPRR